MKNTLIISLILFIASCAQHDGYTLTGHVPDAWEGKLVFLSLNDINEPRNVDSTTVSDGKFKFQGKFDTPRYCNVVVYLDSSDRVTRSKIINFRLFVDNTAIEATCDNSGQSPRFTVLGGETEIEYQSYLDVIRPLEEARSNAFSSYAGAYYREKDLPKSIGIVKDMTAKLAEIGKIRTDYIKNHPGSAVSVKIAQDLFDRNSELSLKEIEELFATLSPEMQNSEMGQALREIIDGRMIFIGDSFIDQELTTPDGSKKNISDFVKPGSTTLIEFWASWCAPCREEIPHMLNTYEKYHPKGFNILSISIDSDSKNWLQALDEEKLPWGQLLDENSVAFRKYNFTGVPSSVLLDEDGKIISVSARGGWLDATMQQIYD